MDEGFSGVVGALVIALVIGWAVVTNPFDPLSTPGHIREVVSCNQIVAAGCAGVNAGVTALNDPAGWARAHPPTP